MKAFFKKTALIGLRGFLGIQRLACREKSFSPESVKSVLLVETALLGDIVAITPLVTFLQRQFRNVAIDVVVQGAYSSLLESHPYVHRVERLRAISFSSIVSTVTEIRRQKYDLVICVSPGVRNSLLAILSRSRYLSGYLACRSRETCFFQDHVAESIPGSRTCFYDRHEHLTTRAMKSVRPLLESGETGPFQPSLFIDWKKEEEELERFAEQRVLLPDVVNVVIHPTASWEYKQWPCERFVNALLRIKARFPDKVNLVVVGLSSEHETLDPIANGLGDKVEMVIDLGMDQLMVLLKHCDVFVGNDSGPKHIADAFQRPIVELLGPGLPETVGAVNPAAVSICHRVECSPCRQHQQTCMKAGLCMTSISVDEVVETMAGLIERSIHA